MKEDFLIYSLTNVSHKIQDLDQNTTILSKAIIAQAPSPVLISAGQRIKNYEFVYKTKNIYIYIYI
jgi:hypothetical protein